MPVRKKNKYLAVWIFLLSAGFFFQGCAHHFSLPVDSRTAVYKVVENAAVTETPPAFVVYAYEENDNRIGRPVVRTGPESKQSFEIDTLQPSMFVMQRTFTTSKGKYTNRIYRIHFPGVPFSLIPFNLTAGRKSGVMVVVTYNQHQQPVLVTTVHTCGCYLSIIPTNYLPEHAFAQDWKDQPTNVYGETLPSLLDFESVSRPVLLIHLRPEVHRVMDMEIVDESRLDGMPFLKINLSIAEMDHLLHLPSDQGPISFFYEHGLRQGYVKDSFKPFEMLLLSLISLDLFVGTDKIYADPHIWDNRFYTSLKPWRREESDMWDFAGFLDYWGWRL